MLRCWLLVVPLLAGGSDAVAGEDAVVAAWLQDLRAVGKQGIGSPLARAAWDKLVARGPTVLPQLLVTMDTPDTVVANWLRSAFDRIVEHDLQTGGKGIEVDALLAFVKDPRRQGRARRLALDVVERLRPGTREALIAGWLEDPEFRYEAVARVIKETETLAQAGQKDKAQAGYRKAFAAARDQQQVRTIAGQLKNLGVTVSVAEHLGYLTNWSIIGPLDAHGSRGVQTVYPPEKSIDLDAELDGKEGKVRWKRFPWREPSPSASGHVALINLPELLGQAEDAVAFAYTAFRVPTATEVEFRGAADDNFTVWVNGRRVFGFEEYRNGVRVDRHRFRVPLQAGINTVLVKICQAPFDPTNPEPNWEFFLRIADASGKGIGFPTALPAEKK